MDKLNIVDMICAGYEKFANGLGEIIESNSEYQKAQETFRENISTLEGDIKVDLADSEVEMETIAKETAFNEGFKMGVRLILGCISSGKGMLDL